ncbi:MAG TPA: nuclear transport factor 2 family protein [Acidimicrobiales bacterium]|jgi:steroid delta-isomerase-like uncharacterized protein|nr:nuclear transport factor 2 family protein [Acidimicrobiales bacterium]
MITYPASRTDVDALVDDHFQAEIDGDLDRLLATFADEVEHDVVGNPDVSTGKAEVTAFYRGLLADLALDDITSVRRYHGDGFVVDESLVTARAIGTPFGIPGRGRTIRFRLLHVFEIRGGEITRENAWLDLAGVLAQLGS